MLRATHVFLLALAAAAGIGTHAGAQAPRPPNILVLTDDLRYGDLSSYGHRDLKTPVIDRLAANRDVVARLVEFARLRHGDVVRDPLRPATPPLR